MAEKSDCPHCGALKHTPRSAELKADVARRINRAAGQLNGIRQMVRHKIVNVLGCNGKA